MKEDCIVQIMSSSEFEKRFQDVYEVSDKLLHLLSLEAWVTGSVSGKKKL